MMFKSYQQHDIKHLKPAERTVAFRPTQRWLRSGLPWCCMTWRPAKSVNLASTLKLAPVDTCLEDTRVFIADNLLVGHTLALERTTGHDELRTSVTAPMVYEDFPKTHGDHAHRSPPQMLASGANCENGR